MTLETRTVRGIGWSATSQIAQLLMAILISAILARLLIPSDFGLIAMVVVFSNFVAIFSNPRKALKISSFSRWRIPVQVVDLVTPVAF